MNAFTAISHVRWLRCLIIRHSYQQTCYLLQDHGVKAAVFWKFTSHAEPLEQERIDDAVSCSDGMSRISSPPAKPPKKKHTQNTHIVDPEQKKHLRIRPKQPNPKHPKHNSIMQKVPTNLSPNQKHSPKIKHKQKHTSHTDGTEADQAFYTVLSLRTCPQGRPLLPGANPLTAVSLENASRMLSSRDFQIPKMEVLSLNKTYKAIFGGWGFLHFRYLKCLVMLLSDSFSFLGVDEPKEQFW